MNHGSRFLRLGEILLERRSISYRKLQRGLEVARETRQRLGDVLMELGYVSEEEIARCLAEQYGFPYQDLSQVNPDHRALELITPEFALKWCILPVKNQDQLWCVVADPLDVELSDTMAAIARKPVVCSLAGKSDIQHAVRIAYGLPIGIASPKRRRIPQPESVLQRDRSLLIDAVSDEPTIETSRRAA